MKTCHKNKKSNVNIAPLDKAGQLTCVALNCRSIRNKIQNILSNLKDINSDIACLQTTWLNEGDKSILSEIKKCKFKFIRMSRKTKLIGGGLLVICKSQLKIQKVVVKDAVKFETFENLTCKITHTGTLN